MEQGSKYRYLSGSALKIGAALLMLVDHTAAILIDPVTSETLYTTMRLLGRMSFPIFCFLLVEGFLHTSNVKKYMIRLALFALISEIPFDMAFRPGVSIVEKFGHQNIFFTLLIGLIVLWFMQKFEVNAGKQLLSVALGCVLAMLIRCDYSYMGILLIVFYYIYRTNRVYRLLAVILVNYCMGQIIGAWSLIFTESYNGKPGIKMKYAFYIFYPVHLLVLVLIRYLI